MVIESMVKVLAPLIEKVWTGEFLMVSPLLCDD
jgi:hypothetical protein